MTHDEKQLLLRLETQMKMVVEALDHLQDITDDNEPDYYRKSQSKYLFALIGDIEKLGKD